MKRTLALLLVLSLSAMPLAAAGSVPASKAVRATHPQVLSLERVSGAWRMQIRCDAGAGSILLLDTAGALQFRGEGCFAGWSQEQLSATYTSLLPGDVRFELQQLG
jgi:hypothetical protein